MDRRLASFGESSNESGASGSRLDLPSIPDRSRRSESENSDGEEKVDDYGSAGSGSVNGTSDHGITEDVQGDRTSDQDSREKGRRQEMSDLDDSVENTNGMYQLDADSDLGRETMDVLKKSRKTKKKLEVNLEL